MADAVDASSPRIPRAGDDQQPEVIAARQRFVAEQTGVTLDHVTRYALDPSALPGNIEHFTGVAQVPIGIAGPLRIRGEHADGEFLVPLATTEGTLVFLLGDALEARAFGDWVDEHLEEIRAAAEATTSVGRLLGIDHYVVGPLRYLRCNDTTGDAAAQNLTGKATLAACAWIRDHHPDHPGFLLSGNIDTDKKHSQINVLQTRGRRVVAEVVRPRDLLRERMGVDTAELFAMRQVSNVGAFMAGAASNGAHAVNALAAPFIATGQDVANVAESHASLTYANLLANGDDYWSVTLPSLIVATYGGGTGLPTQRECLELLGCYGTGKVERFAEICAGVVLAGEISLSSGVVHGDWVASHDRLGRNRP